MTASVLVASIASDFTSYMAAGVTKGAVLSLAAVGFLLTYRATGVVNFAQGSLITLGAYLAIWSQTELGLPIVLCFVAAVVAMFVIGVGIERVAYAPLRGRPLHIVVISTLGASIVVDTIISLWFGPTPRRLDTPVTGSFNLFGAEIPWHRALVVLAALIVVGVLMVVFARTSYGRQLRAVASDRETARLYGVSVNWLAMTAFGLSAALAGLAGVLIAPLGSVDPTFGFVVMLGGFAAAIIGGFGSLKGVIVGSMIIGFVEQVAASYDYFGFRPRDYQAIWPFVLLLIFIAVRPRGLFPGSDGDDRL